MSLLNTLNYTGTLKIEICCHENCRTRFAMDQSLYETRRNDHQLFYCPRGHSQYYSGKSDTEKLQEELNRKNQSIEYLQRAKDNLHTQLTGAKNRERSQKAAKTRVLNRVKNGVCPCCNRTFKDLADHMKTKHPEVVK